MYDRNQLVKYLRGIVAIGFTAAIIFSLGRVILQHIDEYIQPYYNDALYKNLESVFNNSQYRQKNPTSLIPDETVFSYAAGAYLRGIDPILINSEHTPLGKYILALGILWFKNDKLAIPIFGILSVLSVWLVARHILNDSVVALIPTFLFSIEPLFINQFQYTPLLDVIQLPFIYLSLLYFMKEFNKKYFWITGICLGLVMATKTIVPGVLLIGVFLVTLILYRKYRSIVGFCSSLLVSAGIFVLSYTKTFLSGYSFLDFVGFQKWIFLYQKSRLLYPFSVWKLIYLNRWQTWWGDFSELRAEDWTIAWPILFTFGFIAIWYAVVTRKTIPISFVTLLFWVVAYELLLSLGVVTTRFFLPLLPALYITMAYLVFQGGRKLLHGKVYPRHSGVKLKSKRI